MATPINQWGASNSDEVLGLAPRRGPDLELIARLKPNELRFGCGDRVTMNALGREAIAGAATGVWEIAEVFPNKDPNALHPDLYELSPKHPCVLVSGRFFQPA